MERKYDYYCETNGKTLEVEHSWSIKLQTWGELIAILGIEPDGTPRDAPISRLIGSPTLLRKQENSSDVEKSYKESSQPKKTQPEIFQPEISGLHPIGCLCGCYPLSPGAQAFQQELLRILDGNGDDLE